MQPVFIKFFEKNVSDKIIINIVNLRLFIINLSSLTSKKRQYVNNGSIKMEFILKIIEVVKNNIE